MIFNIIFLTMQFEVVSIKHYAQSQYIIPSYCRYLLKGILPKKYFLIFLIEKSYEEFCLYIIQIMLVKRYKKKQQLPICMPKRIL